MQIIRETLGERVYCGLKRRLDFSASKKWLKKAVNDFFKMKNIPLGGKLWAYKKGYYSRRILQYDLNKSNSADFISDLDYLKLYPINSYFARWIDDKLTLKLVLAPFDVFLPKYYFHIIGNDRIILKLTDCPDNYERTVGGIIALLRSEKQLAFKQVSGSHGEGFYKLGFDNGIYFCNGKNMSEAQISKFIGSKSDYIVTEFVKMHEQIAELFPDEVSTIRIMCINEHGDTPVIGTAYLRVETCDLTDKTVNAGYGPLASMIDLKSGYYDDPVRVSGSRGFIPYKTHPDTGVRICGYIPGWESIKNNIIEISAYMPQIEYMGFDVVVTPEGHKILEINSFQDLFRFDLFNFETKNYFSRLLRKKGIKSKNGF